MAKQITNSIVMVRPIAFCFNTQTAANDSFQVAIHVGLALAGEQVFLRPAAVVGVVAGGGWLATRRGGLLIGWPKW